MGRHRDECPGIVNKDLLDWSKTYCKADSQKAETGGTGSCGFLTWISTFVLPAVSEDNHDFVGQIGTSTVSWICLFDTFFDAFA